MAVVSVNPIHPRRRAAYRDSKTTYTLLWLVKCDSAFDGPAAAIWADGIPRPGDVFVDYASQICPLTSIEVDPRQNADRVFEVLVNFDTPTPGQADQNPLDAPWGWSWSYAESTEDYFIDRSDPNGDSGTTNKNVVNSAGEAFERWLQRERGELQITMTRNEATHDAAADDQYCHTINSTAINLDGTTFAIGTLKLSPIGAVKSTKVMQDKSVVTYYAKTFQFKARHQGWLDTPLDVGFNELVGDKTINTQTLRPIVDANGLPFKKPWPLDGTGKKKENATDTPATLSFAPYFAKDWTALNLSRSNMAGVNFSLDSAKRIVAAVKKIEQNATDLRGDNNPGRNIGTSFWAMVTGAADLGGKFHDWVAVQPSASHCDRHRFQHSRDERLADSGAFRCRVGQRSGSE